MKQSFETSVCWASLLIGLILCLSVGWLLMRAVRRRKLGRFAATAIQGGAIPVLGIVPIAIAHCARSLVTRCGYPIFNGNGGNDGNLVGVGIMGLLVAIGAALLFAAIMLFQALTGSGRFDFDDKE